MRKLVSYYIIPILMLLAGCLEQDPSISKPSPTEFFVEIRSGNTEYKKFVSALDKEVVGTFFDSDSVWHLKISEW